MNDMTITNLYGEVKHLIETAKTKAIKAVDFQRVLLYWSIGEKIFNEVQKQKNRADYGKQIIKNLSIQLEPVYGSGYSYRQLYLFLQFYKTFQKVNTLYSQLSWSHYKLLIRIEDEDKNQTLVELTLPKTSQVFASKYKTILPNKEELKKLIEKKTT